MSGFVVSAFWQTVRFACVAGLVVSMGVAAEPNPAGVRQPDKPRIFVKYDSLSMRENPLRVDALRLMAKNEAEGWKAYNGIVEAGREVYYKNCFFCHGDLLDGKGPYAHGFNPQPATYLDADNIAQLQSPHLFWRPSKGSPEQPGSDAWNGQPPVWHEMLSETQVWQAITFLYDYVGQVPRLTGPGGNQDALSAHGAKLLGKELFAYRCQVCHGRQGAGDGVAAERMYPKPRDFTLALFKYKTSPGSELPTDENLFHTIKNGLPGTGMPTWGHLLTDAQIRSLIPVIKRFDTTAAWAPEDADDDAFDADGRYLLTDFRSITDNEPLPDPVPFSETSTAKGKKIFEKICAKCHGLEGRGNITSGKKLKDDWGNRIWPRDLTKPWTWRATNVTTGDKEKSRDEIIKNIYTRLSLGIPGTPMPAHQATEAGNKDPISQQDRWHVANYVYSLRKKSVAPDDAFVLTAAKIDGALPETPTDDDWNDAPAVTLPLVANIVRNSRPFTPLNDAITVRALYNANEIAFLLEVDDRTDSRPGEEVSTQIQDRKLPLRPDAMAIQFPRPKSPDAKPVMLRSLFRHGFGLHPTTLWYWNAGSVTPAIAPQGVLLDTDGGNQNIISRPADNTFTVKSEWQNGQWRVLMKRPRQSANNADIDFNEDAFIPISFADWDGSNGEEGTRHTLTTWHWLVLSPQSEITASRSFTVPLFIAVGVFLLGLLGLLLLRRMKKAKT